MEHGNLMRTFFDNLKQRSRDPNYYKKVNRVQLYQRIDACALLSFFFFNIGLSVEAEGGSLRPSKSEQKSEHRTPEVQQRRLKK